MDVNEALEMAGGSAMPWAPVLAAEVQELRAIRDHARRIIEVKDEQLDLFRAELDQLRAHILDIDAHATPFGDLPDDPGYVGMYLVTAGALHRALGRIGRTAPSCTAEAELAQLRAQYEQRTAEWERLHADRDQRTEELERLREEFSDWSARAESSSHRTN